MINELIDIIQGNKLSHRNTIVIGNNSSGKSEFLKRLLLEVNSSKWYLIDSVNRYFSSAQIFKMSKATSKVQYSGEILKHRLMADNYNLRDTFFYMGVPTPIENFYFEFSNEINNLLYQFLNVKLDVRQSDVGYKIYLDDIESSLSSGYQALIRIFMEMEYVRHTMESACIVIDEIDEFLFSYNSGRILEFLRQHYKDFSFVVTTHSADLIAHSRAANIVLLSDGTYELLDAEDFNSVSQVYNIFKSIFQEENTSDEKEKTDAQLRRLLNNKVAGIWKEENQQELVQIKGLKLTKVQKVLVRQIEEW